MNQFITQEEQGLIEAMSESEMESLLLELASTRFWPAILKYAMARMETARSGLASFDPATEATKIARTQGVLAGILDIQNAVMILREGVKKAEEGAEKEKKDAEEKV